MERVRVKERMHRSKSGSTAVSTDQEGSQGVSSNMPKDFGCEW